jgi:hypothetical protein
MYRRSLILFFRSLVGLIAAGYLLIQPNVSPAVAAQLTTGQVSQFLTDPSQIFKANPNGGRLVSAIRDLMLSDTCLPSPVAPNLASCQQVLQSIIGLLANANDAQKAAIGTGLGEAAQAMVVTNPSLANDIQTALTKSDTKLALDAYQTTVGNQAIGAVGGGGAGGAGAAAYETLTNAGGGGGGGGQTGSTGTSTTNFGLTGGGNVSGGGNGTTANTATAAVSPL